LPITSTSTNGGGTKLPKRANRKKKTATAGLYNDHQQQTFQLNDTLAGVFQ
jgi:hypothetical protein